MPVSLGAGSFLAPSVLGSSAGGLLVATSSGTTWLIGSAIEATSTPRRVSATMAASRWTDPAISAASALASSGVSVASAASVPASAALFDAATVTPALVAAALFVTAALVTGGALFVLALLVIATLGLSLPGSSSGFWSNMPEKTNT